MTSLDRMVENTIITTVMLAYAASLSCVALCESVPGVRDASKNTSGSVKPPTQDVEPLNSSGDTLRGSLGCKTIHRSQGKSSEISLNCLLKLPLQLHYHLCPPASTSRTRLWLLPRENRVRASVPTQLRSSQSFRREECRYGQKIRGLPARLP